MKFLNYIHYFSYLAFNWDIRIAIHIILQEIKGEKKYGIDTTGVDDLKKSNIDISNATIYMPVSYDLLKEIFNHLPPSPRNHFLDIGCGKGRAVCVAANNNFKKITGIDFSQKLCAAATLNTIATKRGIPEPIFEIIHTDAVSYPIPPDVDCIFLFNPFNAIILEPVIENILKSIALNKRKIHIVYVNPLHKDLFIKKAFTEIYYSKRLKYLEVSILKNNN